jgi:Protein of unknown function (DUF1153)
MIVQDTQSISPPQYPDDKQGGGKFESGKPVPLGKAEANLILPPMDTKRWSSRRKAAVVVATRTGVLTREEARERYLLSHEELAAWEAAFDKSGIPGLRISSLRIYRRRAGNTLKP